METKRIVLKSLTLENFRAQNRTVEFGDNKTVISGKNKVGKSSIMSGWMWLMSSYASADEVKNENLFNNLEEITENTPQAIVKAKVSVDGIEYLLEKRAKAKFVRRRGTDTYEKAASDEYSFYIDNVNISVGDFNKWIETNICPSDMIQYCINGAFIKNLIQSDKNKARKVLEAIIGEITDDDMKGDYSVLKEDMMKKYSVEAIEERTKNEIKPIKARMEEIPSIIKDKESALAEYKQINFEDILCDINTKKKEIEDIDNLILGNGEAIKPILGQRDAIFKIINDKTLSLSEHRSAYLAKQNAQISALKREISNIRAYNAEVEHNKQKQEREIESIKKSISYREREVANCEKRRETLLQNRDAVKAKMFEGEKCAYCGQELPADMLEEARARFNEEKKRNLEIIVKTGKENNEVMNDAKEEIVKLKSELEKYSSETFIPKDSSQLEDELSRVQSSVIPFEETDEYKKLASEIEDIKGTLPEIPQNDNDALTLRKKMIIEDLDSLNRRYGLLERSHRIESEIKSLKEEVSKLAIERAFLENKLDKCKEYRQERADIISSRVNGRLNDCQIDMWSAQKDGSIVPDVVLKGKDGVRYSTTNFSDKIKIGIDLQFLFMEHYDVLLPVFIDEVSVFDSENIPSLDCQTIYLKASDYKELTVEEIE